MPFRRTGARPFQHHCAAAPARTPLRVLLPVARGPENSMKRMLIDASHPEETRVVILDGSKVEEFDFEAASKRPLKGNIYLAKVTRVEPSLQAAFVEYGGNRQGFLAFSEIHPDYYQIPFADRQALLAEQEAEARRRSEDEIESFEITSEPKPRLEGEEEEEIVEDESAEAPMLNLDPPLPESEPLSGEDALPEETSPEDGHEDGDGHEERRPEDDTAEDDIFVNHAGAPQEPAEPHDEYEA